MGWESSRINEANARSNADICLIGFAQTFTAGFCNIQRRATVTTDLRVGELILCTFCGFGAVQWINTEWLLILFSALIVFSD